MAVGMYVDIYGCMYMYMYMYVCLCVYIFIYSFKENLKFQRVLEFFEFIVIYLLPVTTSILTSSPQYTGSNNLKLHKITDLYVKG